MASLLQTESISKSYGDLLLFENISLNINEGQHVGLVAPNGTGKTTLMRILAGKDNPDGGLVTRRKDLRVGYLEQDPTFKDSSLVIDEVFSPDNEIFALVRDYEMALAKEDQEALARLMPMMDLHQAWDHEVKARQILSKLRVTNFRQPVGQLSGGQKKRLALAAVLIREPELLILDEPTNHLDLDMIEWLEEYIAKARCALFMVTHDRYFLDRACDSIYEMDQKSIFAYEGNYTRFIEKREERLENDKSKTEKAKNLFRKELDWIRRMPQARATKAKYRVDAFQDIKEEASKRRDDRQVQINFQSSRLGNKILEIKDLSKSFGNLKILDKFSYIFSRFEKVGIVGENGSGKSTFLNLITGELSPDKGIVELGETVVLGYYRQEGIQFREDQKVIEAVTDIAEVVTLGDGSRMGASQFLNFFLFPPETQHAYISRLSGGERRRLYLVTILMKNPNFLILDEPTNDLDIMTLNVLEEFLAGFPGCVIIVSHDRFFMDKVVDHLFVFNGGGNVKDFPGNYSDYRETARLVEVQKNKEQKASSSKERAVEKNKPARLSYKEKKEFEELGHQIDTMEEEKAAIEQELASGKMGTDEVIAKSKRHEELQKEIERVTDRWLDLSERE